MPESNHSTLTSSKLHTHDTQPRTNSHHSHVLCSHSHRRRHAAIVAVDRYDMPFTHICMCVCVDLRVHDDGLRDGVKCLMASLSDGCSICGLAGMRCRRSCHLSWLCGLLRTCISRSWPQFVAVLDTFA